MFRVNPVVLSSGAAFFVALGILGCLKASGQQSDVAKRYATLNELQPQSVPYQGAYLIFGGVPVETKVRTESNDGKTTLFFESNGAVLDEERYAHDETTFRYLGNQDEGFEPGITLLRFPFDVGEEWTWSGTYRLGPESRKAEATCKSSSQRLNTVAGEFATVRIAVELKIESGAKDPVTQKLTFWFAPKRGVVRREFQYSTTREPMPIKNEP